MRWLLLAAGVYVVACVAAWALCMAAAPSPDWEGTCPVPDDFEAWERELAEVQP